MGGGVSGWVSECVGECVGVCVNVFVQVSSWVGGWVGAWVRMRAPASVVAHLRRPAPARRRGPPLAFKPFKFTTLLYAPMAEW